MSQNNVGKGPSNPWEIPLPNSPVPTDSPQGDTMPDNSKKEGSSSGSDSTIKAHSDRTVRSPGVVKTSVKKRVRKSGKPKKVALGKARAPPQGPTGEPQPRDGNAPSKENEPSREIWASLVWSLTRDIFELTRYIFGLSRYIVQLFRYVCGLFQYVFRLALFRPGVGRVVSSSKTVATSGPITVILRSLEEDASSRKSLAASDPITTILRPREEDISPQMRAFEVVRVGESAFTSPIGEGNTSIGKTSFSQTPFVNILIFSCQDVMLI
jgi:hypothetical protein